MPEPAFFYDIGSNTIRLIREEGEAEADYLLRQAEHHAERANRARELVPARGPHYQARALSSLAAAAAAIASLSLDRQPWANARLRRLMAALDWSD